TRWLRPGDGQVQFVFFELTGVDANPFVIEGIRFEPSKPGFLELQGRLFGEWFQFTPWTQRSTNQTRAAMQPVLVSPAIAVGAWVLLAWLICAVSVRGRPAAIWPAFLMFAVCGWLLLDVRWQTDLLNKDLKTVDSFYGKAWKDRRLADIDGQLFDFVRKLKERAGVGQRRLFALGDAGYWRVRARYHGLPWSTRSTDRELDHEWTRHLQSGDLMLRLDAPGIQQKGHRGGSDHDNGFKKVFETFRIVGNGARLIPGVDEPVIQIDPDSEALIRSTGNVLPGKTF